MEVWYKVVLPTTRCAILEDIRPPGPVHTVFTVTGTSTDVLNSTVQVKITEPPTVMVDGLLAMSTVGVGTESEQMA